MKPRLRRLTPASFTMREIQQDCSQVSRERDLLERRERARDAWFGYDAHATQTTFELLVMGSDHPLARFGSACWPDSRGERAALDAKAEIIEPVGLRRERHAGKTRPLLIVLFAHIED